MSPEFQHKIFEMFQTLKPRDTLESTGVGLALVKKIVESQSGSVQVISAEGQGAQFIFTWPKVIKED
ncbi:ATP-binding protein [Sporomusa carbonis]|uniref:ATP-binding protein n=1 Tax=Sporomusa carbonis TaxID=3076075 RepID=UPI003C7D4513